MTWPTSTRGVPVIFAQRARSAAQPRTWLTLPALDSKSGSKRVWMESTSRREGFMRSATSRIRRTSVSAKRWMSGLSAPSRRARSLICRSLSSPEA